LNDMRFVLTRELPDQFLVWWQKSIDKPDMSGHSSERITGKPSQSFEEWLEKHKDPFLVA
jgi:hypothetical protein